MINMFISYGKTDIFRANLSDTNILMGVYPYLIDILNGMIHVYDGNFSFYDGGNTVLEQFREYHPEMFNTICLYYKIVDV